MEDGDLPPGFGGAELAFQPCRLIRIEVVRIEHEELGQAVTLLECVIAPPAHIKERVLALVLSSILYVVVAKHGVEFDSVLEQGGEWPLEALDEAPTAPVRIDVVTCGDHEIERRSRVRPCHLGRYPGRSIVAGPPVAEHRKSQLVVDRLDAEDGSWFEQSSCGKRSE